MITINPYRGISLQNEWLEKVILQLNRDIRMTGLDKEFDTSSNLSDFYTNCMFYFESLLQQSDQQLFNLLYRIDVNQQKIYDGKDKPQELIAQLVIERTFQKVVLKSQFS